MLFPATLGPWPHGGLVCPAWDAPALFQTQLLVRLLFLLFFSPGLWGGSGGGSAGCVGCAGRLQPRAVPMHTATSPAAAAQPGAAWHSLVPLHGADGTSQHPPAWWDPLGRGWHGDSWCWVPWESQEASQWCFSLQTVLDCWMAPKEQGKVLCLQKAGRWHSLLEF